MTEFRGLKMTEERKIDPSYNVQMLDIAAFPQNWWSVKSQT